MCNPNKEMSRKSAYSVGVPAAPFLLCLAYDSDVNSTLLAFSLKIHNGTISG